MADNILVERRPDGTAAIILIGRLDAENAGLVEQALDAVMDKRPWRVILDLGRLNYIASAGIRIILKLRQLQLASNGKLFMLEMQPQVKRVFELMQLLRVQEMFDSEADLDAYLDSVQQPDGPLDSNGRG